MLQNEIYDDTKTIVQNYLMFIFIGIKSMHIIYSFSTKINTHTYAHTHISFFFCCWFKEKKSKYFKMNKSIKRFQCCCFSKRPDTKVY